jgi:colanic acid biosynthesis glycosyl transferase WcaI
LESLVEAAAKLRGAPGDGANPAASDRPTREIVVVIIGDGVMKLALQNQISAAGVERHIRMLPLLLERDYRDMLMASDVCLVTQAPGTGQYFFPSKLLSVLAAGTPVLSVADRDSELARAVDEGRFGVNVAPGNPQALADKLRELAENPAPLTEMRIRTSWVRRFSASHVLGAFEQRLRETVETKPG